jgi:predicted NBD/HSP70 family sugar kinase
METLSKKNLVRWLNEHDVLQLIFNASPISRSQVAQQLPLNKVTVSGIFNDLIERGLVLEIGEGLSGQNGGRKPTMSQFNAHYGYVVSFDLGAEYLDQLVTYLDGSIISFEHFSIKQMDIHHRVSFMATCLNRLDIPFAQHQLLGIAIAIHGIIDNNQVVYSPFIRLNEVNITNFFTTRYSVPVLLENEANLAAVYERDFNGQDATGQNLITISIHQGIGASIIIKGKLYRGHGGEAGEIGNAIVYETIPSMATTTKTTKTIEQYCSESAIVRQLRTLKHDESLSQQKDRDACAILKCFAFYMATVVHNAIVSYAPGRVILNSMLIAELPELLLDIKRNIHSLTHW